MDCYLDAECGRTLIHVFSSFFVVNTGHAALVIFLTSDSFVLNQRLGICTQLALFPRHTPSSMPGPFPQHQEARQEGNPESWQPIEGLEESMDDVNASDEEEKTPVQC